MHLLRLDRFCSLFLARLRRPKPGLPILMYHSISTEKEHGHPYYALNTSPQTFRIQLAWLKQLGYRALNPDEIDEHVLDAPPGSRTVWITFDDGYRDFLTHAFPVLQEFGFHATVFLSTAFIGGQKLHGKNCLNWAEARELKHATDFVSFGSHTTNHARLRELPASRIAEEIENSKHTIEDELDCSIDSFSYPYAFPEEHKKLKLYLKTQLLEAGYRLGVSTQIGISTRKDELLFLRRLPINDHDDASLVRAKLRGAYDWLGSLQRSYKHLRRLLKGERWEAESPTT